MTLAELFDRVIDAFARERVDFMLIGGMAVAFWVRPRTTQDCDIVVRIAKKDQGRLKAALVASGSRVTALEMRLLFERKWIRTKTSGPMLDVHRCLSAHDKAAFDNAETVEANGRRIRVASPEDLVLYKLQAWRPQDRLAIEEILEQVKNLDRAYIESWFDRIRVATNAPMRARWAEITKTGV